MLGLTGLLVSMLAPLPAATAAVEPLPSDLNIVVTGGGWGHGHGMSQYGARAQAEAGRSWRTILDSYYTNVDVVDRGSETLRVLLASGGSMVVGGPESYRVKWYGGSWIGSNSSTYPYMKVVTTDAGLTLYKGSTPSGSWTEIASGTGRLRFYPDEGLMPVVSGGKLNYYRGLIEAYPVSTSKLYTINQLSMEQYLYGVVPREMPAYWHESALRAQAVAARSYSGWKKNNSKSTYHICATTQCQVYGGYGYRTSPTGSMTVLENSRTTAAVDATSGLAMVYDGYPIFAEYHSSSGGHTSQGSRSYLAPREDPWDAEFSPYHRWSATVSVSAIEAKWTAIGRLAAITNIERDGDGPWGGRVTSLKLVGTDGSVTVSGSSFRFAFSGKGVRSTLFTLGIYDAEQVGSVPEVVVAPGQTAMATVILKNTGNRSWPVGRTVVLETSDPKRRSSVFRSSGWITSTRASYVTKDLTNEGGTWVSPGQLAAFTFPVTASSTQTSGLYLEAFRPVVDGITWFGSDVIVPVRVGFASASQLSANLLTNASFEAARGDQPDRWRVVSTTKGAVDTGGIDGERSLKLPGDPDKKVYYKQWIKSHGYAGERLVVSAWNRAKGVSSKSGSRIDIRVKLNNKDGTRSWFTLLFPQSDHGWTYRELAITAPKRFTSITIYALYRYQKGSTWYDHIRLARDWIPNSGFEAGSGSPTSWALLNTKSGDGRDRYAARSGRAALRLSGGGTATAYARQYLKIGGREGRAFRLSGWNRTIGSSEDGGSVAIWARVIHTDGTAARYWLHFPRGAHDWTYRELTFKTEKAFKRIDVFAWFGTQSGTAWFDEIALGRAGATRTMTSNSGFELGSPAPGDWTLINAATSSAATASAHGSSSLHLPGASANVYARQYIPLGGLAGDVYVLSGYNRTVDSSADGGPIQVWARVRHLDGTSGVYRIDFPLEPHDWQRRQLTITTEKPYWRIDVFAKFAYQTGDAWFDSVRLIPVSA